jgi:hypothetical protein
MGLCTSSLVAPRNSTRQRSRAVHPSDGSLPEGQVSHVAGPSADGWTIVAIHDSKESWEKFRDGTLMPRFEAGIDGGFAAPPEETTFEVDIQVSA